MPVTRATSTVPNGAPNAPRGTSGAAEHVEEQHGRDAQSLHQAKLFADDHDKTQKTPNAPVSLGGTPTPLPEDDGHSLNANQVCRRCR